ncbi:hypothetical protein ACFQZT_33915 [Paenibacillus sp. GCM10027628]
MKNGKVSVRDVRELQGVLQRENGAMGLLVPYSHYTL